MSDKISKYLKIIFPLIVLTFTMVLFSSCLADEGGPYFGLEEEPSRETGNLITVAGSGSYKTVPDLVLVNITIVTEKDSSEQAVSQNSETSADVTATIEQIEAENLLIQTTGYNVNPLYDYHGEDEPPVIYSYRATTVLEISTTEISKIGEIIAGSIGAGANNISSLRFDLSDSKKKEAKIAALQEATQDGRDKAYAIAGSLDVQIDKIYYISETETFFPPPVYALEAQVERDIASPVISPQEVEVTANIQIAFTFR